MSAAAAASSPASAPPLPPAIASYLSWGQSRLESLGLSAAGAHSASAAGGVVPGAPLCVARSSVGEGCGLFLARDIPAGEAALLFRVPSSMQFRSEHSSLVASLLPPASSDTAWLRMTLSLLAEWSLGPKSAWSGFLAAMPSRTDQPQFWSPRQMDQLQGCSFAQHCQFFDLQHEYQSKILPWIKQHGKALGMNEDTNCSFDRFCLVTGWIISRAFRPSCTPELGPVLLPLVDLFNTTSMSLEEDPAAAADAVQGETGPFHRRVNCSVRWVAGGERGDDFANPTLLIHTLPSPTPLRKGQQLFLPYGSQPLGSADLLVRYGFVEGRYPSSENPFDGVSLSPGEVVAQLQGGGPTKGPRGQAALTAPAEATEDEEARALHRKHQEQRKKKQRSGDEDDDEDDAAPRKGRKGAAAAAASAAAAAANKKQPSKQANVSKRGGKRRSAAAASAAAAAAEDDDDDDEDDDASDSGSEGSAASGSSLLLDSLSDLAASLPVESFVLPASGEPPARLLQFVGVVLGVVDGQRFVSWLEADAEKAREKTCREVERNRRQAMGGGSDPPPPPPSPAEDEQQAKSPCPSPSAAIGGLSVANDKSTAFGFTAATAVSSAASSSDESAAALDLVRNSSDVLEALFFLYHSLLAGYATTLQEDDRLLTFLEQREEQRAKEWNEAQQNEGAGGSCGGQAAAAAAEASPAKRGAAKKAAASGKKGASAATAAAASTVASSVSSSLPEASADSVRMLLALRARMSEKRVLYRALEWVQQRLAALAAEAMNDTGEEEEEVEEAADEDEEIVDAPGVTTPTKDGDDDDEDAVNGADHPDPNILSPSLFKMLASQKRPLPTSAGNSRRGSKGAQTGAAAGSDDDDEEEQEDEQTGAAAAAAAAAAGGAAPIRFTYTKGSSRSSQARKKRRG